MRREHVYFFEGVDPAPSESHRSDDGAIVDAVAHPRRLPEVTLRTASRSRSQTTRRTGILISCMGGG